MKVTSHKSQVTESGFTLVELLISIAVISIISVSIFLGYGAISRNGELKTNTFKIVDVLNLARTRTLASLGASSYGVHFEQTQYALFKGATYNAADPDTIFYMLPASVELDDISLAGGVVDVVFERITGKTTQTGSVRVQLVSDPTKFKIISIIGSGRADIAATTALSPSGTRVTDSRHTHVTYNQNIAPATTLTLDFPGYTAHNVDFQSYYSGGLFDWSGTVSAGGADQVVRVHTHTADASSAVFSVTRDGRYNNTAMAVVLDGQELLTYTAGGAVALGSSVLVSDLVAQ